MDPLTQCLTGTSEQGVLPSQLKVFGLEAADEFLKTAAPLDDTIAGIVMAHDLNHEQTQRVVEVANNAAFKGRYEKQASKVVEFPVADVRKIRAKVARGHERPKTATAPPTAAHIPGSSGVGDLVADMFGETGKLKLASADDQADSKRLWLGLRDKAAQLEAGVEGQMSQERDAVLAFQGHVKQALLNGEATLHDIADALRPYAESAGHLKQALGVAVGPLVESGDFRDDMRGADGGFQRQPNPEHPIIGAFQAMTDAHIKVAAGAAAATKLRVESERLYKHIRS